MIEKISNDLLDKGCILEEAQVFSNSNVEFWHSSVLGPDQFPISGGFAKDRFNARKIAISEYLERTTYRALAKGSDLTRRVWGLDLIPTACGFAAGFNRTNTIIRSISEAVERWVMSQWIDEGREIEKLTLDEVKHELDPISEQFASKFDSVLFFKKEIKINLNDFVLNIVVAQTMGIKDGGIYPGSSAQRTGGSIWQHALLESYRHYLMVKNNPNRGDVFPDNRIQFFARNADLALSIIDKSQNKLWPTPNIKFHRCESFENESFYIARTIINGWRSWHEGPIDRFLY